MNMSKRFFAFLLALIWALALAACGAPEAAAPSGADTLPPAASTEKPSALPETAPPETQAPTAAEGPSAPSETETPTAAEEPSAPPETASTATDAPAPALTVSEDGWYDSKEEVALYLHLYGHLPDNYVTKQEAEAKGWTGGSVERYTGEGTAIGGSRFGNYEGLLPKAAGRTYTECDIGTVGASSRGAKRLVFSNDGLIYYTEDHYESFELLYGEP